MTKNHNYYLNLAFQIAEKNLGNTKLNPSVGCVVVKNGSIISSGVTSINGRPHSEFNALNSLKNSSGASLYTTLEPCSHYGKTPPCVDIIIKKKIKKVFYAFEDPDDRSFKRAKKILNNRGVQCKLIKSKRYVNFYNSYYINKKKNLPYVTSKIAISKDCHTINRKKNWITNESSRRITHLIRHKHDCIMSTSKSINSDNSLLNCRINGLNQNKPDLFILDLNLRLKKNLTLYKLLKNRKTYLITSYKNKKVSFFYKKKGFRIIYIKSLMNKIDFLSVLKRIYKMGYSRMLIESGLTFLNFLLLNRITNELYIFKSNTQLGKKGRNNSTTKHLKKISLKKVTINLNGDKLFRKEFKNV